MNIHIQASFYFIKLLSREKLEEKEQTNLSIQSELKVHLVNQNTSEQRN